MLLARVQQTAKISTVHCRYNAPQITLDLGWMPVAGFSTPGPQYILRVASTVPTL